MISSLRRKWFALLSFRNHLRYLNARVGVEQVLLDYANGKKDALSREEARALAFKLGANYD
jgi:hypothetical protein